jgi:hypothetical protein
MGKVGSLRNYMFAVVGVVAFLYFVLGTDEWDRYVWAFFTIFTAWIVLIEIRNEAGIDDRETYLLNRSYVGFSISGAILIGGSGINHGLQLLLVLYVS